MSDNKPAPQDKTLTRTYKTLMIIFGVLALAIFAIVLWLAYSRQITDVYTIQVRNSFVYNSFAGALALIGSLLWALSDKLRKWSVFLLTWAVIIFLIGILAQLVSYK
jgi:hypothetical protein